MVDLRDIETFGEVSAEDDTVQEYFLETDEFHKVADGKPLLVLGRKGSGKTAIVRMFTDWVVSGVWSRAVNFRTYPWRRHSQLADQGSSEIEAFIASWRFVIAVELAQLVFGLAPHKEAKEAKELEAFLRTNYGSTDTSTARIIEPNKVHWNFKLAPKAFGIEVFEVALRKDAIDDRFGFNLNALTDRLLTAIGIVADTQINSLVLLHFDELDHGLSSLNGEREAMLVGLILAARSIKIQFQNARTRIAPIIYLRSDLWDELRFSDKNKISETSSLHLDWTRESLAALITQRARFQLGNEFVDWSDLDDGALCRGTQQKWSYICARTYLRPRDVIKYCNVALHMAQSRALNSRATSPILFCPDDLYESRKEYSHYLKHELDDEIVPHWANWSLTLDAISSVKTVSFTRDKFDQAYEARRDENSPLVVDALASLFRFSVIGYQRPLPKGGSEWIYKYLKPQARWFPGATRFKTHSGLKEYCELVEARKID